MNRRRSFIVAAIALLLWLPVVTLGQTVLPWAAADVVEPQQHEVVKYGALGINDGTYYRLRLARPAVVQVQVAVATNAPTGFQPQVVVFSPDELTVGPVLPIAQPPATLATLYPASTHRVAFEPFTQVFTKTIVSAPHTFGAGETYVAVYNAGNASGRYRLTLNPGSALVQWQDAWQLPVRWWHDQTFAGWGWQSFLTPLLVGLAVWAVWLRLQHHHLHPQRRARATKKKRS